MDSKPDMIREDIDVTRSALTEKLETLEGQLRSTVESAKQSVDGTIENVKDSIRHLSPVYQTTQHPFAMIGAAAATGLLAGRILHGRRTTRGHLSVVPPLERAPNPPLYVAERSDDEFLRTSEYESEEHLERQYEPPPPAPKARPVKTGPTLFERFTEEFDDEIQMVKGMLLKGAMDAASDMLKRSVPNWSEQIDQVVGSLAQKVPAPASSPSPQK